MACAMTLPRRWAGLARWAAISVLVGLSSLARADGVVCDRLVRALNDDRVDEAVSAVRAGCNVNGALDGSGATALMWARSRAMGEALLGEGAVPDQRNEWGHSAVAAVAARGDLDYLRLLIQAGARADSPVGRTCGPLCEAVYQLGQRPPRARAALMRELVRAGAPIDNMDCWGRTALYAAAAVGSAEAVNAALALGANPSRYETFAGDTLLIQASATGDVATVDALLKAGASPVWPNARSCQTPLHAAASRGNAVAVRRLLDGGARLPDTDAQGRTALDAARAAGHTGVAEYLLQVGAKPGGSPRTDCVNVDTPDAWGAWQQARRHTRTPACSAITSAAIGAPTGGSGR